MTLPALPTVPQPSPFSGGLDPDAYQWKFLNAEDRSTARLMQMYQAARLELEEFVRHGDLTASDQVFYRHLLAETNRIATDVNGRAITYTSGVLDDAFVAGHRTHSGVVVPREALSALARDGALGKITQTSDMIRQAVRGAIAQGILQGLPADQLRARILATGLTNIPHWPSVEYRAGVIARTETMFAYNAGALAGIESTGAPAVQWIVSPDEAVCPKCSPRDDRIYLLNSAAGGTEFEIAVDAYPGATALDQHPPLHPRCRCTLRAVYRGPDGHVFGNPRAPELPADAMGGKLPAAVPSAVGDLDAALVKLNRSLLDLDQDEIAAMQKFWQGADLRANPSFYGKVGGFTERQYTNLTTLRYGIRVAGSHTVANAQARQWLIEALDEFEKIGFKWREHRSLQAISFRRALSGGARNPAQYIPIRSEIEIVPARYPTSTTPYRIGTKPYMQSSMIHELGHAIDDAMTPGGGIMSPEHFSAKFTRIHRATPKSTTPKKTGIATAGQIDLNRIDDELKKVRANIEDEKRTIERLNAGLDDEGPSPIILKNIETHRELLRRYEAAESSLLDLRDAFSKTPVEDVGHALTDYAETNEFEDYADTVVAFLLDPVRLREASPARWEHMKETFPEAYP